MNILNSWEAQTKVLIYRVQREIEEIEVDAAKRGALLEERKWAFEIALEAYREMMGSTLILQEADGLSHSDIDGKTFGEILLLIASRNDYLLIVRHAIKLMKAANVFGNPLNADSAVYSVLNRNRRWTRIGRGVYKWR